MKLRMQKPFSISTIPVLALALLLVSGTALADDAALGDPKPAPALTGTTEHDFVGHLETFDDKGRLLAWEGTISGDINGVIQWWMGPMSTIGHLSYYVYRVEIWNSDKTVLLLAGEEVGSTTAAPGKDAVWRGNGIVTEASAEFEDWIGRQVYESGRATWAIPGVLPDHGVSTFLIPLVVDFNGDGKVDNTDISIMAGYWNTGDPVCDIGPAPLGDGIVDAQDLLVLTEYLTKPDVEADIVAIEDVLNQYTLAMETGDLDHWMSLYTDDTIKMLPDEPAVFGKEDLRASMKPLFDNFIFEEMVLSDVEIQVAGDWAFCRCNFTATMTPKAVGELLYMNAKDLCIYRRQADGSWKISRDCWNSNVPPTVE
jgi:uncharacterized protein (TIGR02246 family)